MAIGLDLYKLPCSKCLLIPAGSRKEKNMAMAIWMALHNKIIAPTAQLTSADQFPFRFHDVEAMQIQSDWSMRDTVNAAVIPLRYKRWLCITVRHMRIESWAWSYGMEPFGGCWDCWFLLPCCAVPPPSCASVSWVAWAFSIVFSSSSWLILSISSAIFSFNTSTSSRTANMRWLLTRSCKNTMLSLQCNL